MTTATLTVSSIPSRRWARIGRGLMALNSAVTFAVFINGFVLMADASDDRMMVEGWRTFGYLVFAAMWAMLAYRPRQGGGSSSVLMPRRTRGELSCPWGRPARPGRPCTAAPLSPLSREHSWCKKEQRPLIGWMHGHSTASSTRADDA